MATFSLGGSAPGVYINERAGAAASAAVAGFSTVYMLVECSDSVSVTTFPFNTPVAITSLNDYLALIGGTIPEDRIPLLSYNCVNEFFQNAQVGDLRVVRVGTPDNIVEVEFLPSGTKLGTSGLPSALFAGDLVYVQMTINGQKLVAGDGSTGYSNSGEWLGVPVEIPVDYISGDQANNRRIATAMVEAVTAAIESNPAVSNSVYVRSAGLVNDLDVSSNSENGFITLAASTYDANVSVVTEVIPVGTIEVFTQNAYDVQNIVGGSGNIARVPQDYTQCIGTAFDGQQDQGYLVTPTAYAQFDAEGRALVGQIAALHCASNNYKWMALADPGPFLVTDVNEYSNYTPHEAAADLVTGLKYLVDNAIYEWTAGDVTYIRAPYLEIVGTSSPEVPVSQSSVLIADNAKYGLLDPGTFTLDSVVGEAEDGKFILSGANWPSTEQIQEVTLSDVAVGGDFSTLPSTVYIVAPPYNLVNNTGEYCVEAATGTQYVFIATDSNAAASILSEVVALNGTVNVVTAPAGAFTVAVPTGSTCTISYATPAWSLPVTINGQESNLIQNISGADAYINTNHLPATLQDSTDTTRLGAFARVFNDFNAAITLNPSSSVVPNSAGAALVTCVDHGLTDGQRIFLTQSVWLNSAFTGTPFLEGTTKFNVRPYYVKVYTSGSFLLCSDLTSFSNGVYIQFPTDPIVASPGFMYSEILGGSETSLSLSPLTAISMLRARKYGFAAGTISNEACPNDQAPAPGLGDEFGYRIHLSNSSAILGPNRIAAWGEDVNAGYIGSLVTPAPGTTTTAVENFYCAPTIDQSYSSTSYLVPGFVPKEIGSWDGATQEGTIVGGATAYGAAWVTGAGMGGAQPASYWQGPAGAALVGNFLFCTTAGLGPNGEAISYGDSVTAIFNGTDYDLIVIEQTSSSQREIEPYAIPFWGSQVTINFFNEQTPPSNLWRFDAITSTEIISDALRGVGSGGVPQADFIEAGVDNVNRLYDDSQRYGNDQGFIAYYGSYIENGAGQYIPPSPYVTGVAVRRYRSEGYQFPPAGVKYQLTDAVGVQIPINSAQQNQLNSGGCNAIRTLPGYPTTAVYIWGGRTRLTNPDDAQQKLYQFVNTRVILNVVYGSLRNAFDTQIFNVVDGFGVVFNQIISVGNSILNQLYVKGALFGSKPSDAFQVICDARINSAEDLENGIVNAKVFVTPVPTLERIQIDLIRVAIGNMQNELDIQGLGSGNQ